MSSNYQGPLSIQWEGKTYLYDERAINVRDAIVIKNHTGLGLVGWQRAVRQMEPEAMQGLLWIMKQQAGERCSIAELDFSMTDLMDAFGDAIGRALAAQADTGEAEVDPTGAAATPPG